jgi:1D-myo-inositol 3-kinase
MAMSSPDFVAIGHVTLDHFGDVVRPGGAALYAAITAQRLGLSAAILTSHAPDFPLDDLPTQIEVVGVEAPATTAFEHRAAVGGRVLRALGAAQSLTSADLPPDWREAPLVLLAPVLQEVDPPLAMAFRDATVGAEVQGWLRATNGEGVVSPTRWASPNDVLDRVQAIFVSGHDVRGQDRFEIRPRRTREVDATGAGDVFAAAFLVHYDRHGDPWDAAEAATCAASLSVEGEGWSAVPDPPTLAAALDAYRASSR